MYELAWDPSFDTGHERIDFEHRTFLSLFLRLDQEIDAGADDEKILRTVAEIQKYAEYHFLSEENIMADIGFPGIAAHRITHLRLLNDLYRYVDKIRDKTARPQEVVIFMYDWFMRHTHEDDIKIARFIAQHNG